MSTETQTKAAGATPPDTPLTEDGATEYRGVTVLMADIVASTDHMEELGPENYADLLRRFHAICNDAVRGRGGTVAQYQGDGIICYFGFPRAAEDDAAHAVQAALDIIEALTLPGQDGALETRIGVASGPVMLRSDGDQFGANAVGRCINKAARLEALAEANAVLVCEDTRRLVGALFQMRDLGEQQLKGFRKTHKVYVANRARDGVTTRFEALRGGRLTDLIGRQAELDQLRDWLQEVRTGAGKSAVISGDAGLGKSRLLSAFLQDPALQGAPCFLLQCSPEHVGTPLRPVTRYLEWVAGTGLHEADEDRHAKLKRLITRIWGADDTETDILLDLVSPLGAEGEIDQSESVPLRRQMALTLLVDKILASVAGRGAFVIAFEDVHWIDPTSVALLDILAAKLPDRHALLLMTTRPEPPFGDSGDPNRVLRLAPLDDADSQALVRQTLGEDRIDAAQMQQIIEKSDGVPLFVQEYSDMVRASEGGLDDGNVPLTLAGLVQTKLDRLTREQRAFARTGAALGRSFDPDLVARIVSQDAEAIPATIQALSEQRLASSDPRAAGGETLAFSHALVRDAIYSSMTGGRRRHLHNAIVNAFLDDNDGGSVEDHVVAYHLAQAGRHAEAIERYFTAGGTEAMKGAAAEALSHLDAGLACIPSLPEGPQRDLLELQLCAVRGPTLMVTRGPGSPDFGTCQARAMELVERLDMHADMVPVIFNTAEHAWAVADLDRAQIMAEAIEMIDQRQPTDAAHMAGALLHGMVAWHRGDNAAAATCFERVLARHEIEIHKALYGQFIKEFGVFANFYLGLARTIQGDFETGRILGENAIALSDHVKFPHERGFALLARFNTAMLRDDVDTAFAASAEARDYSIRQGFPEFVAMAVFVQGWSLAKRGDVAEGLRQMEDGLTAWTQTGFTCWQAMFAAIMAPWQVQLGRLDDATALVDRYLALVDTTGENQTLAPLLLARAIIERERGATDTAAQTANTARAVAREQGAPLWRDWIDAQFPT